MKKQKHTPVSAPVTWFGSKSRLVKKIVSLFPEHNTYVDVFGGSGAMLLGKPPSKVEVYNDLNKKMVCLFNVLSDQAKTKELIRRLELTPYSRETFKSAAATIDQEQDDIELAKLMMVVQRQSHGGLAKQWSYCVDAAAGGYSASVRKFHTGIERLPEVHKRMRKVQVENMPFQEVLSRYDRAETLFYLDPPYIPETRVNGTYEHEMTIDDHIEMVAQLRQLKGKSILSGYAHKVYQPLENDGWHRIEIDVIASTSKSRASRTECLWLSPNCLIKKEIPDYQDIANDKTLTNRQKAAKRVHRHRTDQSTEAITKAINSLKRMKKRVTKVEVARMTGISREHITRYYSDLF
ncbi:TPA: DNA adenine methylase [Vibrio parahaemolyticus]|nr:DNA adenine methylase [Vibrio parahaemolyticus]